MKHRIDPKIDCVFKALLGTEKNRRLLIHFLNAILTDELEVPIIKVEILNPYNEKEFLDDKLSVVDVKAQDDLGRFYQVEIQIIAYSHLPARILYTWADIYSQQLESGQDYHLLKPTYSIWLLAENLIKDEDHSHTYKLRDGRGRVLLEHGGIWLLELQKFYIEHIESEKQRWLKFFKEGGQLDENNLPPWMNTEEMRQAMSTLKQFSDKDRDYHAYQARQNFLREQRTIQWEREQAELAKQRALQEKEEALQEKEEALQEKNAALQEKEEALREIAYLKTLLAEKNITYADAQNKTQGNS